METEHPLVPHPVFWTPTGDIKVAAPSSIVDPDVTERSWGIGHAAAIASRAPTGV